MVLGGAHTLENAADDWKMPRVALDGTKLEIVMPIHPVPSHRILSYRSIKGSNTHAKDFFLSFYYTSTNLSLSLSLSLHNRNHGGEL